MLLKIFDIICIVPNNIHTSRINTNNRLAINVGAALIDSEKNGNNYGRDRKKHILAVRYQRTIGRSTSLFSIKSIYKYIGFIYLWLPYSITFIFTFAKITSSNISMICIFTNIFIISLSKKLVHVFFSFKENIRQHLN